MSSRRRRKTSRTRRIDGTEAQQRQAAEASAAFWHGGTGKAIESEQPDADTATSAPGASPRQEPAASDTYLWDEVRRVSITTDPTSTVRSVGKPPLAGRETVAEHYFEAVYQRAVAMAGALAAAGNLLDEDDGNFTQS